MYQSIHYILFYVYMFLGAFFKLLLWHYLPAYFYPDSLWYGAVKQNEFGFLIPYALFETMSATLSYSLTDFPI